MKKYNCNELISKLNKLDMERSEIIKKLRTDPEHVVKYVSKIGKNLLNKYYQSKNEDMIYKIKSILPRYNNGLIVEIVVEKYNIFKNEPVEEIKQITCNVLPKDVRNFLTFGDSEISLEKAKKYYKSVLLKEKELLLLRMREIDSLIK